MKSIIKNIKYRIARVTKTILCLIIPLILVSCNKYLDAKPDQSISTPSTVDDLEGILNAYSIVNARYPSASEVASDDYYLTTADFNSLTDAQRYYYCWQKSPNFVADYSSPYQAVEYANIILESLPKVTGGNESLRNKIRGNGLFLRGSYHYAISQVFAKPYNLSSANSDLGIALRMTADAAIKPVRSTLAETYRTVIADLKASLPLLPASPEVKYSASKPAAYGMLARVYLSMSDYKNAGLYADSALSLYNTLINYNTLSTTATLPFKQFNDEVIYDSRALGAGALTQSKAKIDTLLYASYTASDLRKTILFKKGTNGTFNFKGTYAGATGLFLFNGVATDELYLIKAETAVRNGDSQTALNTLNTLLINRWKKGTYIPYAITDPQQLLDIVLTERRKELPFRTLRWSDLRRLNLEPQFAVKLTRNLSGAIYTLEPNSLRYVFQIDQKAVDISGLQQNP